MPISLCDFPILFDDAQMTDGQKRLRHEQKVTAFINRAGAKVFVKPSHKNPNTFYVYSAEEGFTDRLLAAATSGKALKQLLKDNSWVRTYQKG